MKKNRWSNVRDIDESPYSDVPFLLNVYIEHPEFLSAPMIVHLLEPAWVSTWKVRA